MIGRLGTILKWIILLPVLIVVVLLAVANDHSVTVHLNPFDADDPVLKADLALYQVGFVVFAAGAIIGGLVAWRGQRKHRKRAREQRSETARWQARAETSEREAARSRPEPAAGFLPRPEGG